MKKFSNPRLLTVQEWPKVHPWPPEGGLRHLIFHSRSNGFDKVIRRCGRRVLIDEAAFFQWVDERGAGPISVSLNSLPEGGKK